MKKTIWLVAILASFAFAPFVACSADDADNQAPVLNLDVGNDVDVFVGDELRIVVRAQDPEGGKVNYDWQVRPEGQFSTQSAEFFESDSEALFVWAPIASDVTPEGEPMRLIFIATDAAGKTTEKTVNVKVLAGNGVPRFLNNQSELYDPRIGKPLQINVRVRDDDSNEVELTMDSATAPVGATFSQEGPFEATFEWQPSVEQLQRRVHSVTFLANDQQNDVVEYKVTIVIRTRTGGDLKAEALDLACPGEEVISHSPLTALRTFEDYVIKASLTPEAQGKYDRITAYFTGGDPYKSSCPQPDENGQCFESIELETEDGITFRGSYGNQVGVSETVYYQLCAIDDDSSTADAVVCAPSAGEFELYYSFPVISPDEEAACVDDFFDLGDSDNNSFETANRISADDFAFFRTCEGDDDYHAIRVKPGEQHFVAVIYSRDANINVEAFDNDENAIDVTNSDCTGLSGLEVSVPEGGSEETFYIKVTGDNELAYQVRAVTTQGGTGGCIDDAIEPNETAIDAHGVNDGDTVEAEICVGSDADLYKIDLNTGDKLTVTNSFTNQNGNLDMELFAPSQAEIAGRDGVNSGVDFTFGTDDMETLEFEATETGTHYLLVFNNEDTSNTYSLNFAVDAAPPCPDTDTYSAVSGGNHTQSTAGEIPGEGLVELTGLTICPGQADWYKRNEFNGAGVLGELRVTGGGELSDVTLDVVNGAGDSITPNVSVNTTNGSIDFDYTPTSTQTLYLKVLSTVKLDYEIDLVR